MNWTFQELTASNGLWDSLNADWKQQCEDAQESYEDYAVSTLPLLTSLIGNPEPKAGVYALHDGKMYVATCQLNATPLPRLSGVHLRVRHVLVCPAYDFNDVSEEDLGALMGQLLHGIHRVSDAELKADHIRIHLRSPLEMTYFRALAGYLGASGVVKSVESKGAWIYLTK